MTYNSTTDTYQRYSEPITRDLINAFINEASMQGKPLWLFTLHPGVGRSNDWRFSTFENTYKATNAFIQLANSYLLNKKSPAEEYLRAHVVIERSERHKWHSHLLVQQCIHDNEFHTRQLDKLKRVVNDATYVVETRDGKVEKTKKVYLKRTSGGNAVKHFYMLRGLLRCAHCGTLLSGLFRSDAENGLYYCPKKERVWGKQPPTKEEKWKRGRVCKMTRSLNINATDELVWNTVMDVVGKSKLLKEDIKKQTFAQFGSAGLTSDQIAGHKHRIKTLTKQLKKFDEALVMLESNRILEQVTEKQYPQIRANITAQKVETESEIDRLQGEVDGVARDKRWVNWLERFQKRLREHKKLNPEQRKAFLEGMLVDIGVELVDPNTHVLTINFELPVVEDDIDYIDPKDKSKGYFVKDGKRSLSIKSTAHIYSKKKQAPKTL